MPTAEELRKPTFRSPNLATDILVATDITDEDLPNWAGWQEEGKRDIGGEMVDRRGPDPTKAGRHYLLIGRAHPPFPHSDGFFCTPGGFVDYGECPSACAPRELREETGIKRDKMTLIGVYGAGSRDPRRHVVSIAYGCVVTPAEARVACGDDDAFWTEWVHEERIKTLLFGFDHSVLVRDGIKVLAKFHS